MLDSGTDHASIATEAKVVAKLKSEGVNKSDITREEFLTHAWDWTNKYGGTILEQLKNWDVLATGTEPVSPWKINFLNKLSKFRRPL